jgi:cell wall-associated NlpC family hydrolase
VLLTLVLPGGRVLRLPASAVSVYAGGGQMVHSPSTGRAVETVPVATASFAFEFCVARRYLQ